MKALAIAGLTTLLATPALAVEKVPMPPGATDIHFLFNPGECAKIRIHGYGGEGTTSQSNSERCFNDEFKIDFTFKGDEATGFYIFPVFEAGAPETVGRKTVVILDAYWSYKDTFYAPVWTDGKQRVAVIPEPATWGLMLFGFGIAGLAARRGRFRGQALAA